MFMATDMDPVSKPTTETVWKFPMQEMGGHPSREFVISMPPRSVILTLQIQYGVVPTIWALVDREQAKKPFVRRDFVICGTGEDVPNFEGKRRNYIATYASGSEVWHVFEFVDY